MSAPILKIQRLSVEFLKPENRQPFFAVQNASFEVERGSFTSIVGESGSGKSATALSVCQLNGVFRRSGEIFYFSSGRSQDLLALDDSQLLSVRGKEISYIFQDPGSHLNPVIKVGRQIDEAYLAHFESDPAQAAEKSRELLASLGFRDPERVYHAYPHQLSGGMKQRALIAMALITSPKLLIADEPTTALDEETQSQILSILSDSKAKHGLTVLFVTHNIALALERSDRIIVMEKGRVVEVLAGGSQATPPQQDYTRRLVRAGLMDLPPKQVIGV